MSSPPISPRTFRYHSNHEPLFSSPQQFVEFAHFMSQRPGATSTPTPVPMPIRRRPIDLTEYHVQSRQDCPHLEEIARQARRIHTLEADLRVFTKGTRRRPGPLSEIALQRRNQRHRTSERAVPLLGFEAAINRNPPPAGEPCDHKISV